MGKLKATFSTTWLRSTSMHCRIQQISGSFSFAIVAMVVLRLAQPPQRGQIIRLSVTMISCICKICLPTQDRILTSGIDSEVLTDYNGLTTCGHTILGQIYGNRRIALGTSQRPEKATLLPWSTTSCIFSVDAQRRAPIWAIWRLFAYPRSAGTRFRTWVPHHHHGQGTV